MDIEIVTVETVREGDGLAMSSRNAYLDEAAREAALCVPRSLELACRLFAGGASSLDEIKQEMRALVEARQGGDRPPGGPAGSHCGKGGTGRKGRGKGALRQGRRGRHGAERTPYR